MAFKSAARFGLHGLIDETLSSTFVGAAKATGGLLSGFSHALTGRKMDLTNKTNMGKVTRLIGQGAGYATIRPVTSTAKALPDIVKRTANSTFEDAKTIKHGLGRASHLLFQNTTEHGEAMGAGFFGKEIRPAAAWALSAGAIVTGMEDGTKNHSYQLGLKTSINGLSAQENVVGVHGAVNQTYSVPIQTQKKINNHGAVGSLGFALHQQRNG